MTNNPRRRKGKSEREPWQIEDIERLRELWIRRPQGLTQVKVAESLMVDRSLISQYFSGETALTWKAVLEFSRALGVAPEQISPTLTVQNLPKNVVKDVAESGDGPSHIPSKAPDRTYWYPLLGSVPAGDPRDAIEAVMMDEERERHGFTKYCPRGFCLRVEGDSMDPLLSPGDIVLVDPDMATIHGDVVVGRNDSGEANIKYLRKDAGDWFLVPANPKYQARLLGTTEIVGVVRGIYRYLR